MNSEFFVISTLNGVSYGLLLFMLSSGLTLIFSMMGVLNFAHTSFYMLGAYFAYTISSVVGFWPALVLAPLAVGALGALFERYSLRRVHKFGHVPELLVTFGLSYLILELVQLVWGRSTVPYGLPEQLQGPLFTIYGTQFPKSRSFIMLVALVMLASVWLLLTRTRIGLVIQAALKHPEMVQSLGHNVPRVFMLVFGGGCALGGLAGVIGHGGIGGLHHLCGGGGGRHGLAGGCFPGIADYRVGANLCRGDGPVAGHRPASAGHGRDRRNLWLAVAQTYHFAGGSHPAVPLFGTDFDLPPQGPFGHAGGLMP